MRYLKNYKIFENHFGLTKTQIDWLNFCTLGHWNVNSTNGLVDIDGSFHCANQDISDFKGIKFGKVNGSFNCSVNKITSLEGSPIEVGGDFYCHMNKLQNLIGGPKYVEGSFGCHDNQLTTLEGSPKKCFTLSCSRNLLENLIGSPEEVYSIDFSENQIKSLEGISPQCIKIFCENNPVYFGTLELIFNKMRSGSSYWISLALLKNKIPKKDWDLLDKSGLTPDLEKGSSTLKRFGIFDS